MNATVESERTIGHADRRWLFLGIGLTAVIIVLAIVFFALYRGFGRLGNLIYILTQASFIIVIAVGMTFVITSAGIDLSVGSAVAFITVVAFGLIKGGLNPFLGVVFMFALGAFIGCLIGGFVA
ncbi:MAG: hypothetical protein OXN84_10060, partial [Albidovulum sp.]|nr:hypothetical protein [Albidovulum sp.]